MLGPLRRPLPPDAPPVPVGPPPGGLAARLWFGWSVFWGMLLSALLSPGLVVQSAFRPTARTFVTWMRPWSRLVLRGLGVRPHVVMRAPLPEGPVVFAANHQTAVDILATSAAIPRPFVFMARHELRTWPVVGWVLEKSACLFIDRSSARRSVESLAAAAERIRAGESVLLFPEGGRSYAHATEPFMRGPFVLAIEAGVPVVPLTLAGHAGVLHEPTRTARPGRTRVVFGAPIPTAGLERRDAGALAEQVRAAIEAELAEATRPAGALAEGRVSSALPAAERQPA